MGRKVSKYSRFYDLNATVHAQLFFALTFRVDFACTRETSAEGTLLFFSGVLLLLRLRLVQFTLLGEK